MLLIYSLNFLEKGKFVFAMYVRGFFGGKNFAQRASLPRLDEGWKNFTRRFLPGRVEQCSAFSVRINAVAFGQAFGYLVKDRFNFLVVFLFYLNFVKNC